MKRTRGISPSTVRRLPRYYRQLTKLADAGVDRISSTELSQQINISASQIRQDLNNFGAFGQQGYGYSVVTLRSNIASILGLEFNYNMIIIGAGNLGKALASYSGFEHQGFFVRAIFDKFPLTGRKLGELTILNVSELSDYARTNPIDIAILTMRADNYDDIAQQIFSINGLKAVWNFTTSDLRPPEGILIEDVHLSDSLMVLSFGLHNARLCAPN